MWQHLINCLKRTLPFTIWISGCGTPHTGVGCSYRSPSPMGNSLVITNTHTLRVTLYVSFICLRQLLDSVVPTIRTNRMNHRASKIEVNRWMQFSLFYFFLLDWLNRSLRVSLNCMYICMSSSTFILSRRWQLRNLSATINIYVFFLPTYVAAHVECVSQMVWTCVLAMGKEKENYAKCTLRIMF